jgi:hypothetical protein
MNAISETQYAYLAGLIDGEGCLFISKYQGKHNVTPVYRAQIIICMTNKEVIDYICEVTGAGKSYFSPARSDKLSHIYRWVVNSYDDIKIILNGIMPHLRVKKTEAEMMLDFVSIKVKRSYGKGKTRPMSLVHKQDVFYHQIMDYKTRGKGPAFIPQEPIKEIDPQLSLFG